MLTHGRLGPFGRIPPIYIITEVGINHTLNTLQLEGKQRSWVNPVKLAQLSLEPHVRVVAKLGHHWLRQWLVEKRKAIKIQINGVSAKHCLLPYLYIIQSPDLI